MTRACFTIASGALLVGTSVVQFAQAQATEPAARRAVTSEQRAVFETDATWRALDKSVSRARATMQQERAGKGARHPEIIKMQDFIAAAEDQRTAREQALIGM